ncbi:DnaD domain protein [Streptococcus danieliae]|uniref:DnaD domain protein n=1 Tax=Streptococcus danieliae TaxID=747656 RepID=A0A7X3G8P0_9STRE|nr:phage replisome organizer N-terminal domain-containing protein [Streptococcus danieliae]MVX59178.1 DnaD domain protein [Streptococcus danieliae]
MAKGKVYFWLKIEKNFFSNLAIKRLRKIDDGDAMVVLYIRMLLESTEDEGVIYFEGLLNDLQEEVAESLDADVELVRKTFTYFENAKLIQIDKGKSAGFAQFEELVGNETEEARRKRRQRARLKSEEAETNEEKRDNVPNLSESVPQMSEPVPKCPRSKSKNKSKSQSQNIATTATADPTEREVKDILDYYQNRIGMLDGYQHQKLIEFLTIDKMESELLKRAIDKSANNSKRNFGYVNAILRNWAQNGIKTIVQQDEEERTYNASKNKGQGVAESNSIFPDDINF